MALRTTVDAMAEIKAAIAAHQTPIFEAARRAGTRDPFEAYAADGLLAMARASLTPATLNSTGRTAGRPAGAAVDPGTLDMSLDGGTDPIGVVGRRAPTKVIVRVDHTALTRGHVVAGETCEIVGTGPVPVTQVQAMLDTGDTFAAAVSTDRDRVTTVAHIGRAPLLNRPSRSGAGDVGGIAARASVSERPAAPAGSRTRAAQARITTLPRQEIDHRARLGPHQTTVLDDLDGYCRHHHALKTRHNYQLAPGTGRRAMTPTATPVSTDPDPP